MPYRIVFEGMESKSHLVLWKTIDDSACTFADDVICHHMASERAVMNQKLETRRAAATALGVSLRTHYRITSDPDLKYPKPIIIAGRPMFDVDERVEWIRKQREASNMVA